MRDVKELMRDHYLRYASYVILDRAIPDLADGLKPVQRRILHTLWKLHDGKFHKVANVAGQTMAYHPHGDAPIYEALVGLANRGFLLDCQGNFGNILTGDSAAAARYIETRLSKMALETLFNPRLTEYAPSYDGRHEEPVVLPAKIPLLLMQGVEGIAVGMATRIFPHNFQELLRAEIALLKGKTFRLYPDFVTGGLMDVSDYEDGRGKIRLRCVIEEKNAKTIVIREICASTTTEGVIASIEEAARKGKIKIDSIRDYTSDRVEIEISLPRGVYAKDVIDQLYAFTDCEVSLASQMVVIADGAPREMTVREVVHFYVERLKRLLQRELELELSDIRQKIFESDLERIFIEQKLYQAIEKVSTFEKVYGVLEREFQPYHSELVRLPVRDDFDRLLHIPIRRIAQFDRDVSARECQALREREDEVGRQLGDLVGFSIQYLERLLKKYGASFPRRTKIQDLEQVDRREMERREVDVGIDREHGYVGTKVVGPERLTCTNFDRLLVMLSDGTYRVLNIEDRAYVAKSNGSIVYCGVADKERVLNCCYRDPDSGLSFFKRFIVKQFVVDREYRFLEEGKELLLLTTQTNPLLVQLVPKSRQRISALEVKVADFPVRGVAAGGIRVSTRPVLAVKQ